jgi:hypothetical protein
MRLVLAAALVLASATAQAAVIDFEADTTGAKPNGFVSASSPAASFSGTSDGELDIGETTPESIGNALRLFGSMSSRLQIDFAAPVDSLSLVFSNDDLCCAIPPAFAWMEIFDGVTSLAIVSVEMNMNDLPDQTIAYAGGPFNRAQVWYGTAQGDGVGLTEVIDNVTFNVATPEPASLALLGAGLLGLAGLRRRR